MCGLGDRDVGFRVGRCGTLGAEMWNSGCADVELWVRRCGTLGALFGICTTEIYERNRF